MAQYTFADYAAQYLAERQFEVAPLYPEVSEVQSEESG